LHKKTSFQLTKKALYQPNLKVLLRKTRTKYDQIPYKIRFFEKKDSRGFPLAALARKIKY